MRTETFSPHAIVTLLRRQTVASLPEIMTALGTTGQRTAHRKLAAIACRSSYSHRGRFYTLDELADYDEHGLWSHESIHFSSAGTLLATAEKLVGRATAGYFAEEFNRLVKLDTQDTLRRLVEAARLARQRIDGRYLYCSRDPDKRSRQLAARRVAGRQLAVAALPVTPDLKHMAGTLMSVLDERQRRLFAGFEAARQGHGGDRRVAEWLGVHPLTVARGRKELQSGQFETARVRKPGGGRKAVEKKRPKSST